MDQDICRLFDRLVSQGDEDLGDIDIETHDLLAHLRRCATCADRMDEATNVELVMKILYALEATSPQLEQEDLDALVETDLESDQQMRAAITDVLLPTLSPSAQNAVQDLDPLHLFAAIEAVSLLARRWMKSRRPVPERIFLDQDGGLRNDEETVTQEQVAVEIARFADLWANQENTPASAVMTPPQEALRLARWLFVATQEQPYLMRHFRAVPAPRQVVLLPVQASERIDEPVVRWSPNGIHEWYRIGHGLRDVVVQASSAAERENVAASLPQFENRSQRSSMADVRLFTLAVWKQAIMETDDGWVINNDNIRRRSERFLGKWRDTAFKNFRRGKKVIREWVAKAVNDALRPLIVGRNVEPLAEYAARLRSKQPEMESHEAQLVDEELTAIEDVIKEISD